VSSPHSGDAKLVRGIGLFGAASANMIEMIGVGPFITIPVLLGKMNGPQAMLGWFLGALVALCDGMVWAELGAAMPGAGGSYLYLSEAYGPRTLGRLLSFLFIWETMIAAPLIMGSGAVGFAQYVRFLDKDLTWWQEKLIAMAVCLVVTALLYRNIRSIGRLSITMWVVVIATGLWIMVTGVTHFNAKLAFDFPVGAFSPSSAFFFGLGGATLIAMYDYGGYYNVCMFAGEVRDPGRVIPRSILLSIGIIAALYLTMNVSILGVLPWREAVHSSAVVSDFIQRVYGSWAAQVVTVLILWTAFASLFANLLGFSRVPFAAAAEGRFFAPFARINPHRQCPGFSLWFMGICSAVACLMTLDALITSLTVIAVLAQLLAQVVAVPLIRKNRPDIVRPYQMPLYPVPVIVAFAGWTFILMTTGWNYIIAGLALLGAGIASYLVRARIVREWPYEVGA
jgi:amino acid transporter